MSKEKQNEELIQMYRDLGEIFNEEYERRRLITPQNTAEKMTAKGYRKQKAVAREIFEEIEKLTPKKFTEKSQDFEFGYALAIQQIKNKIAALKKKYTEAKK